MAEKILDLSKTVYELCEEYPEVPEIMSTVGFAEMKNPVARNSAGRVTTIPMGSKIKDVPLEKIIAAFKENGFSIKDEENYIEKTEVSDKEKRKELLHSYIKRLSDGEDIERVRADFTASFKDVDATEIAEAEQALIEGGVSYKEVAKVCDIHSALFHGAMATEQSGEHVHDHGHEHGDCGCGHDEAGESGHDHGNDGGLEKSSEPYKRVGSSVKNAAANKCNELIATSNHPLNVLTRENELIAKELAKAREIFSNDKIISDDDAFNKAFEEAGILRTISLHYKKKGDLIYPLLNTKYGIVGPSQVMWTVDDEIRDEFTRLSKPVLDRRKWKEAMEANITRADEMIFKETNILFPICAQNFTKEDWLRFSNDMLEYKPAFIEEIPLWDEAASFNIELDRNTSGSEEIVFGMGHLSHYQLENMLNTIPMELTFVDAEDINRYYNDNGEEKQFKRPTASLDRSVYTCHPPQIEPIVRGIIDDFRTGKRDVVDMYHNMRGIPMQVEYRAVRDKEGKFVGTLELVQDLTRLKEYFYREFKKEQNKEE